MSMYTEVFENNASGVLVFHCYPKHLLSNETNHYPIVLLGNCMLY